MFTAAVGVSPTAAFSGIADDEVGMHGSA